MARFSVTLLVAALVAVVAAVPVENLEKRTSGHGQATWYNTGGAPGACGTQNEDSQHIVAINSAQYAGGAHCGKTVHIKNTSNGKKTTAKAMDECPTCGYGDLDLTPSAFKALGNLDDGVLPISWSIS